jgi:hypothetical protein
MQGYTQTINGDSMGGVAAKADGMNLYGRTPLVRRNPRMRHRNTMPKPLKIPANVPEEPESKSKSAPMVTSQQFNFSPSSPAPLLPLLRPLKPLNLDTDTETEVSFTLADMKKVEPKVEDTTPCFTDFSNLLGISLMDEEIVPVTVVDSGSYTASDSVGDMYGWEAELDRKVSYGISSTGVCDCDEFGYRRANGSKRNLLHRVFSMGTVMPTGRRPS